ncbi:hypothetical protein JTE90_006162 [Oedothorax gibbosus]|uniref:Translocon at the inner envelope membrane of chloroplasts 214 n=1 Tax=Oedothorax gibbosus TaxID=931172 RepID=A0AAV6U553_9ARAC|nr:hypothetical protein JTE90_006162 [Oedothorax gibbosus]
MEHDRFENKEKGIENKEKGKNNVSKHTVLWSELRKKKSTITFQIIRYRRASPNYFMMEHDRFENKEKGIENKEKGKNNVSKHTVLWSELRKKSTITFQIIRYRRASPNYFMMEHDRFENKEKGIENKEKGKNNVSKHTVLWSELRKKKSTITFQIIRYRRASPNYFMMEHDRFENKEKGIAINALGK